MCNQYPHPGHMKNIQRLLKTHIFLKSQPSPFELLLPNLNLDLMFQSPLQPKQFKFNPNLSHSQDPNLKN